MSQCDRWLGSWFNSVTISDGFVDLIHQVAVQPQSAWEMIAPSLVWFVTRGNYLKIRCQTLLPKTTFHLLSWNTFFVWDSQSIDLSSHILFTKRNNIAYMITVIKKTNLGLITQYNFFFYLWFCSISDNWPISRLCEEYMWEWFRIAAF